MATFRRITRRDDPAKISARAAQYGDLLTEALELAQRQAASKPKLVREILATGAVEGVAKSLNAKAAAVTFQARKFNCTWHRLIPWQDLEDATAIQEAASMIDVIETNIKMTETNSWPGPHQRDPKQQK